MESIIMELIIQYCLLNIFFLVLLLVVFLPIIISYKILNKSPLFVYPYKRVVFDVSGKRNPKLYNFIDYYLIENGIGEFERHIDVVEKWKENSIQKIKNTIFKKRREKKYLACLDDEHMFVFIAYRNQVRYRQRNYNRTAYNVPVVVEQLSVDIEWVKERYKKLEGIGFQCSLNEYFEKNQRKLVTPKLRKQIAERDNYTCQECGRYMPDGFGLHIDHIVPVSKGGKTVPTNLQVLCAVCNMRKSNKSE